MSGGLLTPTGAPYPVYLVQGEDPSLVAQELSVVLGSLSEQGIAGSDSVEEFGDPGDPDSLDLGAVLNACQTPPFLTPLRVVVVRDANTFDAAAQKQIAAYLEAPLDSSVLVLASVGRVGAALSKAVGAKGLVVKAEPAGPKGRAQWVTARIRDAPLRLDAAASSLLIEHLGEDLARLDGIIGALLGAFGPNATVREADLEPFLGEEGSVAPWDLTDALDEGDSPGALRALHRLMEAGERHPLQLLATLHRHYGAMLRLDGAEISDEAAASVATGLTAYPAKKALRQTRRLGHDRIARAIQLLADADLDLRGRAGWPDELVMEVLVARLAQLVRLGQSSPARSRA